MSDVTYTGGYSFSHDSVAEQYFTYMLSKPAVITYGDLQYLEKFFSEMHFGVSRKSLIERGYRRMRGPIHQELINKGKVTAEHSESTIKNVADLFDQNFDQKGTVGKNYLVRGQIDAIRNDNNTDIMTATYLKEIFAGRTNLSPEQAEQVLANLDEVINTQGAIKQKSLRQGFWDEWNSFAANEPLRSVSRARLNAIN